MKRLILSLAAVLLAVAVVGLAVAQEAPKPAPTYYAQITLSVILKADSMEDAAQRDITAVVEALAIGDITRDWKPASSNAARKHETMMRETMPGPKRTRTRPLSEGERTSAYVIQTAKPMTLDAHTRLTAALLGYLTDDKVEKGRVDSRLSTVPVAR